MGDRYGETESRVLSRECDVVSVPWGRHETLPEGSYALITQRLGSSITVMSGGKRIDFLPNLLGSLAFYRVG